MLVEFGKAGLISKARQQPDKVKQVLRKLKTDGIAVTVETVLTKLGQPVPLGYCNVGTVVEVGHGVTEFKTGQRLVSNGKHAEFVVSPRNLCAVVPDSVSDDEAAFTVLGAIALQSIRLVEPTLGERVAVFGLGLVGLLTVQLLRAQGCHVLGLDFDPAKLALAAQFGAETCNLSNGGDPLAAADAFSRGRGIDAAIIATATSSNDPIKNAATMCRKRGRIVLVGVAGLDLSRADFFEKELSFQVSCSYGPGRYDANYEEKGQDYPFGFVRWTEQRNFEAVLDMMADGRIDMAPLVSHRFAIEDAELAYELISGSTPSLGIVLSYPSPPLATSSARSGQTIALPRTAPVSNSKAVIGVIGAGNYGLSVLMPALKASGARLRSVASSAGVSGLHAAKKFGFELATTDVADMLADPEINAIVITTRHNSHARLVCDALAAGKHVFVEKPLALTDAELDKVEHALLNATTLLTVGFNRRFAAHTVKAKALLDRTNGPKAFIMTVNAGAIPADHWAQDLDIGGGRLIGEACHFIDLLRFLAGHPIAKSTISRMDTRCHDSFTISLEFEDGSLGTINYLANGDRSFPKERLEIFANGGILQLNNFRTLKGYGWPGFASSKLWKQDKGQYLSVKAFINAVEGKAPAPIAEAELFEVARLCISLAGQ